MEDPTGAISYREVFLSRPVSLKSMELIEWDLGEVPE
jgi:hypothetical protein